MRTLSRAAVILIAAIAAPSLQGATPVLKVIKPKEGEVIKNDFVVLNASISGKLDALHVVRIEGFDVTHNFLVDPANTRRSQGGTHTLGVYDRYLPHIPGKHLLRISLYREGEQSPIIVRGVSVKVEQPSEAELRKKLGEISARIAGWSMGLMDGRRHFMHYSSEDRNGRRLLTVEGIKGYHSHRSNEFLHRVDSYGSAAEVYLKACMPNRAEQAFTLAEQIYRQGSGKVTNVPSMPPLPLVFNTSGYSHPPSHMRIATEFYMRQKKVKEARRWILSRITWYEHHRDSNPFASQNDKENCNMYIGSLYIDMAKSCYLFDQDLAGYRSWMKKADLIRNASSGRGGLLGQ